MYRHIVFWKIKNSSDTSHNQAIREIIERINYTLVEIKEVAQFETAQNVGDYNASFYDICLISTFDNYQDFVKYTQEPIHDELVAFIRKYQEDEQIVDYNIE